MIYGNNAEGYRDPTVSAAMADIARERRKKHQADLMRVCEMVLRHRSIVEMAAAMGCSRAHVRRLLTDLYCAVRREYKEELQ